jgi:hypothetical protein
MSSILKVDQLKDSGGNAIITSDGSGNITTGTGMGNYVVEKISSYINPTNVSTTSQLDYFDIAGDNTINFTPTSTNDIIILSGASVIRNGTTEANGIGLGIMQGTSSSLSSSDTVVMANGRFGNMFGSFYTKGTIQADVTGLSANTTYYFEMYGMTYTTNLHYFNYGTTNATDNGRHKLIGVHYKYTG